LQAIRIEPTIHALVNSITVFLVGAGFLINFIFISCSLSVESPACHQGIFFFFYLLKIASLFATKTLSLVFAANLAVPSFLCGIGSA
jgi:membrane-anchored glycerophosphoryl diester phosphodiesterase (GDPDase)